MIVNTQEIRNHRITKIQISNEMYIEVSSRDAIITVKQNENTSETNMRINETCVFYPDGDSEVRGEYDAHDFVVAQLEENPLTPSPIARHYGKS